MHPEEIKAKIYKSIDDLNIDLKSMSDPSRYYLQEFIDSLTLHNNGSLANHIRDRESKELSLTVCVFILSILGLYLFQDAARSFQNILSLKWYIGIVIVAVTGGGFVVASLQFILENNFLKRQNNIEFVPNWLSGLITGYLERTFFGVCVAIDLGGVIGGMIAWTVLKDTALWSQFFKNPDAKPKNRLKDFKRAYTALILGFTSMFFALIGGIVCSNKHADLGEKLVNLIHSLY
ncbi:hypothetical protein [Pontibacter populi]|uniref:Uncharacterized protein n=1 Tax=Pontibacter populi TaxID=890055 RepID=A0ABV1RVL3_9BACT